MSPVAIMHNSSDYVRINAYCGAMLAIIVVIIIVVIIIKTGHI